jgi:transcription elongation factor GreA-like protein
VDGTSSPWVSSYDLLFQASSSSLSEGGVEVTNENKREIDKVIHTIVGVEYKNCPAAWKEVKKRVAKEEDSFVSELKERCAKRA